MKEKKRRAPKQCDTKKEGGGHHWMLSYPDNYIPRTRATEYYNDTKFSNSTHKFKDFQTESVNHIKKHVATKAEVESEISWPSAPRIKNLTI